MADRMTMALVKAARRAQDEGEWPASHSLLLLAILGRLTGDVEAREIIQVFVDNLAVSEAERIEAQG